MATVTFDTLKFARALEKAGIPREQAIAIAEAQRDALSEALEIQLATKSDVSEIKSELRLHRWMLLLIMAVEVLPYLRSYLG